MLHAGQDIARWGDLIKMSGEAPEEARGGVQAPKKWIKEQREKTNKGASSQVTMK